MFGLRWAAKANGALQLLTKHPLLRASLAPSRSLGDAGRVDWRELFTPLGPKQWRAATGEDRACDVVRPPERHIPVPAQELSRALLARMGDDEVRGDKYRRLLRLFETTSQMEFADVRRRVKRSFRPFSLAASGKECGERGLAEGKALEEREQVFISDLITLMKAAHYRLLSQKDWDAALAEDFQLNMPLEVDWECCDKAMLTRYWEMRREERRGLAAMADCVLVFHRGVGVAKMEGLFLSEKVDLLIAYGMAAVMELLSRLWSLVSGDQAGPGYTQVPGEGATGVTDGKTHRNSRIVQRRTLDRVLYDVPTVLWNIHKIVEIQEPTFEDMLVVYRKADHKARDPRAGQQAVELANSNIFIKSFVDVPMADAELIFPEKKVLIKQITKIQLTLTVAAALIGAAVSVMGTNLDYAVIGSAVMLILGRAGQIYRSLALRKAELTSALAKMVYAQARDSQEGAILSVLDEMADQTFKETILMYSLLLTHPGTLTKDSLDEECERFLEDNFNLKIDFALDKCLYRLEQEGLISIGSTNGVLTVKGLDDAVDLLNEKWHGCNRELYELDDSDSFLQGGKLQKSGT
ncbi:unnamed protein product [Ostreobium quekettii]|uniref:Uncharacterized protein n=1 Tax=Ostreobium quekettii TaxID=121088 RepID=A0A8S1JEB1_9CHLO|nr:unnamed protein product [Ostreobium quekettii]|eukprot:evm.model.scf_1068.5 EVM.evm.TU.scf_1068.5   scf_1068:23289-25618(+)